MFLKVSKQDGKIRNAVVQSLVFLANTLVSILVFYVLIYANVKFWEIIGKFFHVT